MRLLGAVLTLSVLAGSASAQAPIMKDPPKMSVTVVVKEKPDINVPGKMTFTVTGSGEASYPDGANLQFGLHLKDDANMIVRAQGHVTAGRWEIALPELSNKSIYHGLYTFQVDFDPELQVNSVLNNMPADKRGRNNAKSEQKLGTPEETAADLAEVMAFYKEQLAKFKSAFDTIKAEYDAQTTLKDRDKWWKVAIPVREKLTAQDSELANFRKRRLNVMRQDLYEALSGAVLTFKENGINAYATQLAFDGKPPKESPIPRYENAALAAIEKVQKGTAAAAKDPEEPKK